MGAPAIDTTELIRLAVSGLGLEDVSKALYELVAGTLKCRWMRICLYPQREDRVQVRFTMCAGRPVSGLETTLPLHGSLPGQAILAGRPIVRDDVLKEGTYPDERSLPAEVGVRSVLVMPLTSNGRTIGTMELGSETVAAFSDGAVDVAQGIADQVGTVVESAWLLEESKELIKLNERKRLAWEIHDTVIQSLISIVLQLELAERRLRSDVPRACQEIAQARGLAQECLEDARRLVLNLRPPLLERSSLCEAIAREVKGLESEGEGIEVKFALEGSPLPLSGDAEMTLYRIAQEAVANVRKHARATKVTSTLRYGPSSVGLTVSDNGVSFDASSAFEGSSAGSHVGLTGAQQRAELIGGRLRLESRPGQGTTLTAEIPIAGTAATALPGEKEERARQPRIRVLLVDDHTVVRHGLRQILADASDIEVVGEAAEADEALERVRSLRPDVAIIDIQLPGANGIDLVGAVAGLGLGTRSLILSAHRGGELVFRAIKAGAAGYLLKDIAGSALAQAIRAVQRGEMVLHPAVSSDLAATLGGLKENGGAETLTSRETEVLRLIALGMRNKEIARELSLTEATVKYHVAHLLGKLGADSRTEALVKAQKLGLLAERYTAL